jgi:FkbM family methyltransferase
VKKILNSFLGSFGLVLIKKPAAIQDGSTSIGMLSGLKRIKDQCIDVKTIIDVGAAIGSWSLSAKTFWPNSNFVLFEPLQERRDILKNLKANNVNFHVIYSAAGNKSGTTKFNVANDLDGSGVAQESDIKARIVDLTSIDIELKKLKLTGPYIIKLDTHGYEVPILEGCTNILKETKLIVIECYGFQIADHSLLFWEMCGHLDMLGFRLVDIVDIMNRPKDGAFWQCDAFFIKKENEIFNCPCYS